MGNTTISYALSPLIANHFPEIEYFTRTENFSSFSNCIVSIQEPGNQTLKSFNESNFYLADSDLFKIIQYPFIEGSAENALNDRNSIVLSKKTVEKYFGNQPALGKSLTLNKEHVFTVTGVVKIPEHVTFEFSMLAPITALRSTEKLQGWDSNGQPFFKLAKHINYKDFNSRLEHFYSEIKPSNIRNAEQLTLALLPITERRLYYNKNPLYLLIFIGFVVLTVSILNYINMSTSLVRTRNAEIAIKKIVGANKSSIGMQFIQETAFISLMAVFIAVILVYIGMPVFQNLVGSDIKPFLTSHIGILIKCCLALWASVTLMAGFYPAVILSGVPPLTLFKKQKENSLGIHGKNILITVQFVISILLVIITLMANRQYRFMAQMPLGMNNQLVMQIPLTHNLKSKYVDLKNELKQIPLVKDACAGSAMPAGVPNNSGVKWTDDKGVEHNESFGFIIVSEGFTQTFEMQMALGNEFMANHPEEFKGIIVNESAAKQLGYDNPVGKQINFWGKQNTVIGVVKDFQNNYIFNKVKPMVLSGHPQNQGFTKYLFVSLLPENINQSIKSVEKAVKKLSPDLPFEYSFTSSEVEGYIDEIKQIDQTFRFASIISIILATIGLIALTYQATQARIKEIGIRKVNGAKTFEIVNMLNGTFLKNILIAFLIACPIGWYTLITILKGIDNKTTISWWIFLFAGVSVGIVTLLTVSFHSWKAATGNPVEALRYE
jgi:putative ABC transport system permease protein